MKSVLAISNMKTTQKPHHTFQDTKRLFPLLVPQKVKDSLFYYLKRMLSGIPESPYVLKGFTDFYNSHYSSQLHRCKSQEIHCIFLFLVLSNEMSIVVDSVSLVKNTE